MYLSNAGFDDPVMTIRAEVLNVEAFNRPLLALVCARSPVSDAYPDI
jgi:hypothetical protein